MLVLERSLLAGVDASAAQNLPVTKTCLQCGAVLPSSVPVCHFCESSFTADFSSEGRVSGTSPRRDPAPNFNSALKGDDRRSVRDSSEPLPRQELTWRGELA